MKVRLIFLSGFKSYGDRFLQLRRVCKSEIMQMAAWILRCLDLDVDIEGTRNDAYQPGPKNMPKTKNFFKLRRFCGSRQ